VGKGRVCDRGLRAKCWRSPYFERRVAVVDVATWARPPASPGEG